MRLHHTFLSLILIFLLGAMALPAFAQKGKSLVLNGTNQYMKLLNHSDFNISKSESFTVCFWIKVDRYLDISSAQRFVSKRDISITASPTAGEDAGGYELWGAISDTQFFADNAPGPNDMKHTNSMSVFGTEKGSLKTWIHLAFVVDRNVDSKGKMYIYQNGKIVGNSYDAANKVWKDVSKWYVNNKFDVHIGIGLKGNVEYPFKGEIDNLRFYKKALSESEMQADMTADASPATEGLVAAYDFENISGITVPDISGKGHNGILYNYPTEGDCTIANASLMQDTNFTGRGNKNEPILKTTIATAGATATDLKSMKLNMSGTTSLNDVTKIKIYSTGNNNSFDVRKTDSYTLLGECTPAAGDITCALTGKLVGGTNYLWITYDVAENALEGNKIDAGVVSITTAKETYNLPKATADGSREILLSRKLLFAPGDDNSKNYRIPAIVTAHDGSLVVATDKRKANQTDLPEDIDVLINRSTDNGKTWSNALTIAQGAGRYKGYGDAGLVRTNEEGGLLCVFVGGTGFFDSTPSTPIHTYVCKSLDNGVTWTKPRDITDQLFGSGCSDNVRKKWYGSFCASGAGLLGADGTIYFVAAVRETSSRDVSAVANYVYYSKDNGETWNVSAAVKPDNGNEAKIAELNDGTLLVSIRNQSKGARFFSTSKDGGKTWSAIGQWSEMVEPGCDGDIIYYTSTKNNYEKNRMLHSVPNHASDRVNVSVFVSYDEGKTWPVKKSICPTGSAYSSLCILPDGTIGAYVEENYNTQDYSMYFSSFSLDWLTDGQDAYHAPGTVEAVAAPTFSIPTGTYDTPQTVELACKTAGAKIYYTLDGSVPTVNATLYSAPIEISGTTTVTAFAVKEGMVASAFSAATYTFSPAGKYCYPLVTGSGSKYADTYVEMITTTGAATNLDYASSERIPFVKVPGNVMIEQGKSFTLNLKAKNVGDYSTSTVRQDLRYTVAVMYIDWDLDYVFSIDEGKRIAGKISSEGLHYIGGNVDVLNITKEIQVPMDAPEGVIRGRVYYTNAWETSNGVLAKVCSTVAEGAVYDFDIHVTKATGLNTNALETIRCYVSNNNIVVEGANIGSSLKVYTTTGQLVRETAVNESTTNISGLLSMGSVYIVKITDGANTIVKKVIK